jgi:DNA-binding NarL/FixJ family response regulator
MTNISKRRLGDMHQKKLLKQLAGLFATSDKKSTELMLTDLFTESEQIMFIKRLGIVMMINSGYSKYRIAKTLLVSESTVREAGKKFDMGMYNNLLRKTQTKQFDSKKFWATVEVLLRAGMPSMGKDRWKDVHL